MSWRVCFSKRVLAGSLPKWLEINGETGSLEMTTITCLPYSCHAILRKLRSKRYCKVVPDPRIFDVNCRIEELWDNLVRGVFRHDEMTAIGSCISVSSPSALHPLSVIRCKGGNPSPDLAPSVSLRRWIPASAE